jgi:anti-anti-sigma regulatory factor
MNPAKMSVSVGRICVFVKIAGRANFTSSIDFKTLLNELMQKGNSCFVLDLTECTLMDSTFLGVLAGFGLKTNEPQPQGDERAIKLFNPNERILELLESLGILQLFQVVNGEIKLREAVTPLEHSAPTPTREQITETCLEAHNILMGISPDNVPRFKDVAAFLADDLKKMQTKS